MYRLQVFDDRTLGMHWQTHKGGAEHHERREQAAAPNRMPVAIALGGDPAMIYAASAPLPPGVDEVVFAGWLRGHGVEMVRCRDDRSRGAGAGRDRARGLRRPPRAAAAKGRSAITPATTRWRATIPSSTSPRSPAARGRSIRRRIVGRPPQEDYWLGKATERIFLPIIRLMLPEIVDMNMPAEGVFHNLVIVSIRKRYPGQARKVMSALWGMGLMMLAKTIVVVSEHVNVHDLSEVAWRATGNIDPRRDLVIVEGPMDDLDHAALRHRFGGKLGVDATEKGPLDDVTQAWPEEIRMSDAVRERVTRRWKEYGL